MSNRKTKVRLLTAKLKPPVSQNKNYKQRSLRVTDRLLVSQMMSRRIPNQQTL